MSENRISVCMATYNGEKFLRKQVQSILCQIRPQDELIVSDNGSTDMTIQILEDFNDARIKIFQITKERKQMFRFKSNHYQISSNFHTAIKNANGKYIFLCDQDDIWHPSKVEVVLESLKNADLVFSNWAIIDNSDKLITEHVMDKSKITTNIFLNVFLPKFHGCCMAFNSKILSYILPFPEMLVLHDNWIGSLVSYFGTVKFIDTDLVFYRRHNQNASAVVGKSTNSLAFKIFYRIQFLSQVIGRIFEYKFR